MSSPSIIKQADAPWPSCIPKTIISLVFLYFWSFGRGRHTIHNEWLFNLSLVLGNGDRFQRKVEVKTK